MKRYFIAGLALLLPIVVTYVIVAFIVGFLTRPFLEAVQYFVTSIYPYSTNWLPQTLRLLSQLLILGALFLTILGVGYIGRFYLGTYLINLNDTLMKRIPVVRTLYQSTKDVVQTLFASEGPRFSKVVLVPYPNTSTYALALVTREGLPEKSHEDHIVVFLPSAPNPTFGYLITYRKDQIHYLDMDVQVALKFILSCGVVLPEKDK